MRKQLLPILLISVFCSSYALAQDRQKGAVQQISLGVASGNDAVLFNLEYLRTHALNPANKFRLGYGIRGGSLQAFNAWNYTNIGSSADTFLTENPVISTINLGFYAAHFVHPLLEIGVYSDLIGLSFGPEQDGVYQSPEEEGVPRTVSASPEQFNLLLGARGNYQAELFVRYWIGKRIGLKAGATWHRSLYVTERPMNNDQRRFRNTALFVNVALSYRWGQL